MHLVYIYDSGDEKVRCFSALLVHESAWKEIHLRIKQHRRALKVSDGMYVTKELHATEFVAGRGRVGMNIVPKGRRCQIFRDTLSLIANFPNFHLHCAVGSRAKERLLFERLLTRIDRTMKEWRSNAIILHDEGKDYTSMVRKMCVYNPIQSQHGVWAGGSPLKNMPLDRILEDIIFRDSKKSVFIQMADFCAYALFRSEYPLPSKAKYGLDTAFTELHSRCIREAFRRDPKKLGIIRDTGTFK